EDVQAQEQDCQQTEQAAARHLPVRRVGGDVSHVEGERHKKQPGKRRRRAGRGQKEVVPGFGLVRVHVGVLNLSEEVADELLRLLALVDLRNRWPAPRRRVGSLGGTHSYVCVSTI